MPSELFVPPVTRGNEHHRLITLCGNSNSSKVGDVAVGICLAYDITANINRNGISAPAGEFPGQGLCPARCLHAGAVQRAPGLSWEGKGRAGELAAEIRNEWCKVHIPLGSKRVRVLTWGPGQFIVQLLLFLLVLQVPGKVWSDLNLSNCHHEELGTRPMEHLNLPFSLAGAGCWQAWGAASLMTCLSLVVSKRHLEAVGFFPSHPLKWVL